MPPPSLKKRKKKKRKSPNPTPKYMRHERRTKKSGDKKEREERGVGLIVGRLLVTGRKMREQILMPMGTSTRQEHAMQSRYGGHNGGAPFGHNGA